MPVTINENTEKEGKKIIAGKIKNYLSNDELIDQNVLFSLLQDAEESGMTKDQLDSLIGEIKKDLNLSNEQYITEEIYREAIHKLSNGQKYDNAFEFYLKERAQDIGLDLDATDRLLKKIKNEFEKKEQPITLGSKLLISLMPLLVLCAAAVILWLLT